jgi:hypothetical protein
MKRHYQIVININISTSVSCCFEMAEEGCLRACLPAVGGVELLFLSSFISCSFKTAAGFSRAFLPTVHGVEILFSASFYPCCFEMAEGLSMSFLSSGVSPGAITEVLSPDVPAAFFEMSLVDLSRALLPSGFSPGAIIEVLGPDIHAVFFEMSSVDLSTSANISIWAPTLA